MELYIPGCDDAQELGAKLSRLYEPVSTGLPEAFTVEKVALLAFR